MADSLFIRLTDSGAAWAAFDSTGRLTSRIGQGTLNEARAALEGRRGTVLVSAVDVITTQVELPAASQARLRQIVPFSLEELLADDVEQMSFAIGARLPSGATPVAVVAKQRLAAWLEQLRSAGIAPHALCSEADGVPDIPATLVLVVVGTRVLGRRPGQPPFSLDGLPLHDVLELVRGPAAPEPTLRHVLVYVDATARARCQDELAAVGDEFTTEIKVAADGVLPLLAATLSQRPGTNLLQGAYAPKSNWAGLVRPWRLAASLLLASGVLALLLQGAQYWQLRRADAALGELVAATCQRIVGDARPSACQREVQQRLGSGAASAGGEDFLTTLAAISTVRDPAMRIDALSYRNRAMDLQLVAANVPALDEFARGLEQTRRFEVEIEAANQSDAGTEGRLRIVGANP